MKDRLHGDKGDDRRDWLCETDPIELTDALLAAEAEIDRLRFGAAITGSSALSGGRAPMQIEITEQPPRHIPVPVPTGHCPRCGC